MRQLKAMTLLILATGGAVWCAPAAADTGQGDSNVFGITAAGTGTLGGTVRDFETGVPIPLADVVIPGQSTQTQADGTFQFAAVDAGSVIVQASAANYIGQQKTVAVAESSSVDVSFRLHPTGGTGLRIVAARGTHCGPERHAYYLEGVSGVEESFVVTIDWDSHPPDVLEWTISPTKSGIVEYPGTEVALHFDIGLDFAAGETLELIAVTADVPAQESPPYVANFDVIPPPPGLPASLFRPDPVWNNLQYHTTSLLLERQIVGRTEIAAPDLEDGIECSIIERHRGRARDRTAMRDVLARLVAGQTAELRVVDQSLGDIIEIVPAQ